jgi:hypothetical protein
MDVFVLLKYFRRNITMLMLRTLFWNMLLGR